MPEGVIAMHSLTYESVSSNGRKGWIGDIPQASAAD